MGIQLDLALTHQKKDDGTHFNLFNVDNEFEDLSVLLCIKDTN